MAIGEGHSEPPFPHAADIYSTLHCLLFLHQRFYSFPIGYTEDAFSCALCIMQNWWINVVIIMIVIILMDPTKRYIIWKAIGAVCAAATGPLAQIRASSLEKLESPACLVLPLHWVCHSSLCLRPVPTFLSRRMYRCIIHRHPWETNHWNSGKDIWYITQHERYITPWKGATTGDSNQGNLGTVSHTCYSGFIFCGSHYNF